MDRDNNSNYSN